MKIMTIVGARPQFIKAAAVSAAFRQSGRIEEILVHTGQHYDDNMSEIFFRELGIPNPNILLEIGSGPHGQQTGRMLAAVEQALMREAPDLVLVYGDTNSTLAGALAASKLNLPVAHVEAGLRSFNRRMPEEVNRVLTDHLSTWLLAPTDQAVALLLKEGLAPGLIHQVGDVMYDAVLHFSALAEQAPSPLASFGLEQGRYVLATIHRAENTDDPVRLGAILGALSQTARELLPVILPLHPRTRARMDGMEGLVQGIQFIPPLGYLGMLTLERHACLIATDSGGVQKEAFFHGVPCVTLRNETEWTELLELGWNRLAPPESQPGLVAAIRSALAAGPGTQAEPYGDGHSAAKIADILLKGGPVPARPPAGENP